MIRGAVAGIDFASPMTELPRAAGSPLLVMVGSLIVLGSLALWELTSVREN